jgi:hypothetical protein
MGNTFILQAKFVDGLRSVVKTALSLVKSQLAETVQVVLLRILVCGPQSKEISI